MRSGNVAATTGGRSRMRRRAGLVVVAVLALALLAAPEVFAQAAAVAPKKDPDHSKDAQFIALGFILGVTLLLLLFRRQVTVTKQEVTYKDAAGTEHTLQQGWVVPPGANVPGTATKCKR